MVSVAKKLSTRPLISQHILMVGLKKLVLVHLRKHHRSDTFQLFRHGTSLSLMKNISEVFIVIVVNARQSSREIGRSPVEYILLYVHRSEMAY